MASRRLNAVPYRPDEDDLSTLNSAINVLRWLRDCPRRRCCPKMVKAIDAAIATIHAAERDIDGELHPPRLPPAVPRIEVEIPIEWEREAAGT